ncbi:MAG TPA: AarF/UbiB family protein [Herpetosiphonaceae bacterium]
MAELCESLGTTYIKFGQLLSTRYDLIPSAILKPLERLQDRVAPFDPRHVPEILTRELGTAPGNVFATFDAQPISSASVACVYRGTLHSGQAVAVKIRRPGIIRMVDTDLRLMRWTAGLMVRIPALRSVPMVEVIDELGEAITQQLNFRHEADHNRRFRSHFAHDQHVRLPALVEEYCTDAVLVMEFLPDLTHINELYERGVDCRSSIVTALKALYQMIFIDGFIHCDLHPGNMYFQSDGHVTFLDTGFVKKFTPEEQILFAKFFFGIVTNGGQQCATIMRDIALSVPPAFEYPEFERAVCDLIARSTKTRADKFQVAGFAMQLFDIQRRFGLRASPNFVMAILALLVFEGIVKTYCADLDFQREAQPFLLKVLIPVWSRRASGTTAQVEPTAAAATPA